MTQWAKELEEQKRREREAREDGYREGFWAGIEVERARQRETLQVGLARMLMRMERTKRELGI